MKETSKDSAAPRSQNIVTPPMIWVLIICCAIALLCRPTSLPGPTIGVHNPTPAHAATPVAPPANLPGDLAPTFFSLRQLERKASKLTRLGKVYVERSDEGTDQERFILFSAKTRKRLLAVVVSNSEWFTADELERAAGNHSLIQFFYRDSRLRPRLNDSGGAKVYCQRKWQDFGLDELDFWAFLEVHIQD